MSMLFDPASGIPPAFSWNGRLCGEPATLALGEKLGRALPPPGFLALTGELGSGKTRLVKGVARGMGIDPNEIHSPTFNLAHHHRGTGLLCHLDVYRLAGPQEFLASGGEEWLAAPALVAIEWADRIAGLLPPETIWIHLRAAVRPRQREVTITCRTPSPALAGLFS